MNLPINPEDFPAASRSTYLNTASVALMYSGCQRAIDNWNRDLAEYGTIRFDEEAEQTVFDGLHKEFACMIGATSDDIAVASSATEQLAAMAWSLMPAAGSKILTTGIVFPTTIYPFSRVARHTGAAVRFLPADNDQIIQDRLLDEIDDDTSVVCLSHVEFSSGQCYDLGQFANACRKHGATLVVDATQSAGAIPIDVVSSGVDVLISGGYKWLCGPFGASVMYVAPHLQTQLDPGIIGFRSNRDIWNLDVEKQDYPDTAHRFEFGTMAYGNAIGLEKSIAFLNDLGVDNILTHNLELADLLMGELDALGAEIMSPTDDLQRTSIVSARIPGVNSGDIVEQLSANNVVISPRRDFFRLSPHLYNTENEIDRAVEEIKKIVR